jgi:hypothetical protein
LGLVLVFLSFIGTVGASEVTLIGAERLDSSRVFVEDIYDDVRVEDSIQSPVILHGEYARVYFDQALTNEHHIRLVARSRGAGATQISVFIGNTSVNIANSSVLTSSLQPYVIDLDNLGNATSDYFDLRTVNDVGNPIAFIRYDLIEDPAINLYGASVSNISHHTRYNGTPPGNLVAQGGNITGANVNSSQLTERWAAFYGNVTGGIVLRASAGSNYVYRWDWTTGEGAVCVTTNSSLSSLSVIGANGSDIDTAWSLASSATDSGINTFNDTNCTIDIGAASVTNASYVDTGAAGGFMTCALKSSASPAKNEMLFCTEIVPGGTAWNGGTADYEVMVPTPEGPATTETYYFYANLN